VKIVEVGDLDFASGWDRLLAADDFGYPLLTRSSIEYYRAYHEHADYVDRSILVAEGADPIAGLCLSVSAAADGPSFDAFGLPSVYFESTAIDRRQNREAVELIKQKIAGMLADGAIGHWRHMELAQRGLSPVGRLLLDRGAVAKCEFSQVIDLAKTEDALFADVSKSFRWNVRWGEKNLTVETVDAARHGERAIQTLQDLHVAAAGRATRTDRSWACQHAMIAAGDAFVVLGSLDGAPVTGAFFPVSKRCCFYGVSASRRELFDRPISHVVLWTAIRHAKGLGCRWFDMAGQRFASDAPAPDDKEMSISNFKRQFGGETVPRLILTLSKDRT
jgi:hypothetical protein